jgi:hypothetical protein
VAVLTVLDRRPTVTTSVVADDPVAAGEALELAVPGGAVEQPTVKQDDGRPDALCLPVEFAADNRAHAAREGVWWLGSLWWLWWWL